MKKVAVLGATGKTGALLVERLVQAGHEVVAVSRSAPARVHASGKVTALAGELTDPVFLKAALRHCDAVVSCLGQKRRSDSLFAARVSPADLLQRATRATLIAIGKSGQHIIYLSAFGVGADLPKHSIIFRTVLRLTSLRDAYRDHAEAERAIQDSTGRWTIVRPVGLTDGSEEKALVDKHDDWSSFDSISRRSLAAFLAVCAIDSEAVIGKVMTVGYAG